MLERASLRLVSKSRRMAALGRKGGLAGGPARAAALTPARRAEIARRAARARWSKRAQISSGPKDHDELSSFVAHYGSAVAQLPRRSQLEAVAIRAVGASRR